MKKVISTILAAIMLVSVCAGLAPALPESVFPDPVEGAAVVYDGAVVRGLAVGASAGDLAAQFGDGVTVSSPSGDVLSDGDAIGTGYTARCSDAFAAIAVYGDLTGDAKANARDVIALMERVVSGGKIADGDAAALAADVVPDEALNARDVIALMKYLVGFDVTLGERFFAVETAALAADAEDETLDLFFEDSLQKESNTSAVRTDERTFVMKLARNEKESCQAILFSEAGHAGLNASLTPFTNGKGETLETTLLYEDYITLTQSKMVIPDRLPPIEAIGSFKINANERQGLYVEVGAGENASAGLYRARLDVTDAAGKVVKTAYVYADVWDFALPIESHVKTAVGLGLYDGYNRRVKYSEKDPTEIYIEYYEYFLGNRINPWSLPYDPADERADRWMNDPRVNTFLVGGGYAGGVYDNGLCDGRVDEDKVAAIYEKLKDDPELMKKTLFYFTDEPGVYWDKDEIVQMIETKSTLDRVFPGATIIVPTHVNFWQDQGNAHYGHRDVLDLVAEYATAPCPKIDLFMPRSYYTQSVPPTYQPTYENGYWEIDNTTEIIDTYGTIFDRLADWKSRGHETWWYNVTAEADSPFVNVSLGIPNMQNRMLWWLGEKYDIDGWLLWATTEWTSKKRSKLDDKNGCLVYPGDDFGVDGPIACQRTGVIRDGLEDTEYLLLAKELLGEDKANEYIDSLVTNVYTFETDSAVFAALRERLGDEIEYATVHFDVDERAQKATYEDATLDLFFEDSLQKESNTSSVRTDERTFVMKLARNEKESCQAILFSEAGHEGLSAKLSAFENCDGEKLETTLLYEDYITLKTSKAVIPDRLPPIEAIGSFGINAGERQGLYVEVSAGENASAGLYRARLDVTDADGKVVKTAYVYAKVWDFAIPVESHVKTAVGLGYYATYDRRARGSAKDMREVYLGYYEYFLNNRVNPWNMPYAPWDERADEWMDDPRVNTFLVGGGYGGDVYSPAATDADIAATYEKLSQNPEWMKKALFYYTDEPGVYWDQEEVNKTANLISVRAKLDRLFPGARIIVPAHINFWQDQGLANAGHRVMLDIVGEYATVPCPKIDIFVPRDDWKPGMQPNYDHGYWEIDETTEVEDTYGTVFDMLARWKAAGNETWWYNVTDYGDEDHKMVNVSLGDPGMQIRMLWWLGEKYDMEGWLLWTVCEWTSKKRSSIEDKNGVLVYPGDDFGLDDPIACQRTGIVRDGIEDVEYLYLARDLLGEEYVNECVDALVTDVLRYETDSAVFAALRDRLGDAIEAATKG